MDWSDFATIPDTPETSVLLSERECNFVLSLLDLVEDRSAWPDISDADWDIVESFLSNLDVKVMGAF